MDLPVCYDNSKLPKTDNSNTPIRPTNTTHPTISSDQNKDNNVTQRKKQISLIPSTSPAVDLTENFEHFTTPESSPLPQSTADAELAQTLQDTDCAASVTKSYLCHPAPNFPMPLLQNTESKQGQQDGSTIYHPIISKRHVRNLL